MIGRPPNLELRQRIVDLYSTGKSYSEIAFILQMSTREIKKYLKRAGVFGKVKKLYWEL